MLPHLQIQARLQDAVARVLPDADPTSVLLRPCAEERFGDYQTTAMMGLAKARKQNPRALAEQLLARLDLGDLCQKVEVAGAGFLNFHLTPEAISQALSSALTGGHLFFTLATRPRTIVIDFSSPNVAKPMHVGHIRSTILGDCLARLFQLLGHRVITDNHLGDWGTQFGMLLLGWKRELDPAALERDAISELERLYKSISAQAKEDATQLEAARQELVKLQAGDAENLAIWRRMIELSRHHFDALYARLGVRFDHTLGESFYNPQLKAVVDDLIAKGIARESDGAQVIFFDDLPALKAHPFIVRKSDGAANYATTDLATLDHRLKTWQPDEIVYVTDGRQQLHFQQLFAAFRKWRPDAANVRLAHVWFGSILGDDGTPFKTRSGDTVKLADLLDEAEERALKVVGEKNPDLPEATRKEIARKVGLGAVKYADLLPNRQSDYVFNWERMLALTGNTAPYLQYAATRISSIFRKSGLPSPGAELSAELLSAPEELSLAKRLLNFGLVLEAMAEEYRPNFLCNYLYELAGGFTRFYETCPVLKAEEPRRSSRLALCDLTARVLGQGLEVLGIETPEQM